MNSAFIWLYAIVGLPLGRVADAWSRKKLLASGMLVWSALTALAERTLAIRPVHKQQVRAG
jgi:MFS family permease